MARTQEHAASQFTDGEDVDFEIVERYVTAELSCVVLIERMKAKATGREDISPNTRSMATASRCPAY